MNIKFALIKTSVKDRLKAAKGWVLSVSIMLWTVLSSIPARASGSIAGSTLATGTENLVKDATSWLLVIAPLVTVVAVIYYFIRKSIADEMDHSAATRCCQ